MKTWAAALVVAAGCRPAPPALGSCKDSLAGVWRADATTASGEPQRYDVVDSGRELKIYPMFDDSLLAPGDRKETTAAALIVAPAMFELGRVGDTLTGDQSRRFAQGPRTCVIRTPARIGRCAGDEVALDVFPIAPPSDWDRCTAPQGGIRTIVLHREHD